MFDENIAEATGASVRPEQLCFTEKIYAADFGASKENTPVENTKAINAAISRASEIGGANVIIPGEELRVYTIHMLSNVNLYFEKGAVLRAARTDIKNSYVSQRGEGGNYDEPEVNKYIGLQDHGHTYFANSLIYGVDAENIMISGDGLIDGSSFETEAEEKYREYVLLGGDPFDPERRSERGHRGEWFGNKGIALVRCSHVVLKDFSIVIGGHFAIITEGVKDLYVDGILADTNRDAFDVDACCDVTVKNSTFNSLTDDGLVLKSSFGAGCFMPLENVLIEDCKVSGYDAGSVYAKTYTNEKLVAEDRCGPTGRIKLGTESNCGYRRVTIRRTQFEHSRGFALEAVDGSDLTDIIFEDCTMKYISSSPIFIRVGDRCRFPVTGMQTDDSVNAKAPNVRIDDMRFVIPDSDDYEKHPAVRYIPSYNETRLVSVDKKSSFCVIDDKNPLRVNEANFVLENGKYYGRVYAEGEGYVVDRSCELTKNEAMSRANGCARPIARVRNIRIANLKAESVDPRYPIILMGLDTSSIENVSLENISVTYRGGLLMEHAVEQRQLNTNWEYTQYQTRESVQSLPWLVNTFFLKNEGLLPRVDWSSDTNSWRDDPYNVPELPRSYPEPSNWGILPAYGMYARHVNGLSVKNLKLDFECEDGRHAVVLDDVNNASFEDVSLKSVKGVEQVAFVTNLYKRPANFEYVPDYPYHMTSVSEVSIPEGVSIKPVLVSAPAPGTPADSLYSLPTLPIPENGYSYAVGTDDYPLPTTVYPPFAGRNPAKETSHKQIPGMIYNESVAQREYTVYRDEKQLKLKISIEKLNADSLESIAEIEKKCFLPAEAADIEDFRVRFTSPAFSCYGAFDENGELIGFVDGACYSEPKLPDELYHDISRLKSDGEWSVVFGVNVLPEYRRKGIAGKLVSRFVQESKNAGKKGVVLTCKEVYRPLYEKLGFKWQGISESTHGGAVWNDELLEF